MVVVDDLLCALERCGKKPEKEKDIQTLTYRPDEYESILMQAKGLREQGVCVALVPESSEV